MGLLQKIREIWDHVFWADARLLEAMPVSGATPDALHEYVHILGAEEVWLSRLERRASRSPVWPEASMVEVQALREKVEVGYRAYLDALRSADTSQLFALRGRHG